MDGNSLRPWASGHGDISAKKGFLTGPFVLALGPRAQSSRVRREKERLLGWWWLPRVANKTPPSRLDGDCAHLHKWRPGGER